uniref:Uncharacterized protein n=1 Tax=Fagus sylvatica TaxID=28930 RepID=A0A2N9GZV9_FAGSY
MEPDEFTMDVQLFMVMEPDEFTTDVPLVMGNQSDEFTIDVPLVMDMEPDKRPECCIYKVTQMLRKKIQPVLELQAFVVGDATECVIRNLMALEQCHYPREAYICNYIVLLDHLINTAEDVDLLVEKKVIVNWLGSNKIVANLINKLSHQIVEADRSYYFGLSEDIKKHYKSYWSKLLANCTSQYFRDFWRGTTTIAGIMLLLFAF